ncbi:MAG: prepilin-type N-terminal cleavage/methylation domain-containing protein [Armatimonadetes bacterium]|nr:prepilin-type N-terminal cleavage/methylation domain-containing protein [Armatimonadota bacterium]
MRTSRTRNKGFTLAEMMTAVGIMAVLTAMATPSFVNSFQRSRENALKSDLAVVRSSVQMFFTDTGAFPNSLADLTVTTAPGTGRSRSGASVNIDFRDWRGPYLATLPSDPISGNAFTYYPSPSGAFRAGAVTSSMSGNDSSGVAFSTY